MAPIAIAAPLRGHSRVGSLINWPARGRASDTRVRWALQNLHQVKIAGRVLLKALQHGLEHFKRFFLVLDQRIMLAVTAQADALLEMVHAEEVIFPLRIEYAQHNHALMMAHGLGAN